MDFEDKSAGWTRPHCQKEYVDTVLARLHPCSLVSEIKQSGPLAGDYSKLPDHPQIRRSPVG